MKSRRRRVLAAPFVVTMAFAPACDPAPKQRAASEPTANPPDPGPDPVESQQPRHAASGNGAWSKNATGRWVYSYESGDQIYYDDGSCELHEAIDCPRDATCNPPPPQKVACPDGLPDEARK